MIGREGASLGAASLVTASLVTASLVTGLVALAVAAAGRGVAPADAPALPDPLAAGWRGEPVCEALQDDERLRVLRCAFPPGVGHERHRHAPHWGYTLAGGRMRITDADGTREVDIEAGSSWESDGVDWHEVVNVGETTTVYLIVEPK